MAVDGSSAQDKTTAKRSVMPPGMVMGPDGKPCKVCTAFRNWKPRNSKDPETDKVSNFGQTSQSRQKNHIETSTFFPSSFRETDGILNPSANIAAETPQEISPLKSDEPPPGCPADVEQLGRATWTFLHTTAAYYPEKPTSIQRVNMLMLLRSLPILYPCTWCAKDFEESILAHPPDVSGRISLSRWLCERHNEVNEKLGKEQFNCAKVDERWKDGPPDGRCD